jgi:Fe-S cluster biogenesis protein NfuA
VNIKDQKQELIDRIEVALNAIRPYLEADGGDVRFLEVDNNMIVKIELLGSCVTCPMSSMTLRAGVEEAIKRAIPEIRGVVAVNVKAG